jgi:hypothetical protein
MVTLGAGFAALAFLRASQLFEFAVKLLNLRTLGVLVLNILRGDWVWLIGDDPINVAACGDYLEQLDAKGQFLKFDTDALFQPLRRPVDVLEVNVAFERLTKRLSLMGATKSIFKKATSFRFSTLAYQLSNNTVRALIPLWPLAAINIAANRSFVV